MNQIDVMAFKLLGLAKDVVESDDELLIYKQFLRNATDKEIKEEFYSCGFTDQDVELNKQIVGKD